ncbi:hypothetical protein [Butyrivibrio sp. VCD2006]|uniref:hypothetical protein n=1 Tax=Butyrivibrio sp. VCD2006 TaxID=1280664 RepID=UPI000688D902|nr:hypothetical protein [Butyrivibrio sp. VCD2006]
MMNHTRHSKTSLFLMELIISIMFFSISGAICIQLFVNAHSLSEESIELNNSVLWTQNISEVFHGCKGNLHDIANFFADNSVVLVSYEDNPEIGTMVMYFDENWKLIDFPSQNDTLHNAKYELLLCIVKLPASEIYADTEADTSIMSGDALQGEITILEMDDETVIDQIPDKDDPDIISDRYTDYYIGTAEVIAYEP